MASVAQPANARLALLGDILVVSNQTTTPYLVYLTMNVIRITIMEAATTGSAPVCQRGIP